MSCLWCIYNRHNISNRPFRDVSRPSNKLIQKILLNIDYASGLMIVILKHTHQSNILNNHKWLLYIRQKYSQYASWHWTYHTEAALNIFFLEFICLYSLTRSGINPKVQFLFVHRKLKTRPQYIFGDHNY